MCHTHAKPGMECAVDGLQLRNKEVPNNFRTIIPRFLISPRKMARGGILCRRWDRCDVEGQEEAPPPPPPVIGIENMIDQSISSDQSFLPHRHWGQFRDDPRYVSPLCSHHRVYYCTAPQVPSSSSSSSRFCMSRSPCYLALLPGIWSLSSIIITILVFSCCGCCSLVRVQQIIITWLFE